MSNIDNTDGFEATTASDRKSQAKKIARQAGDAIKTEAQSFAHTAQERLRDEAQKHTETATKTATKTLGDFASAIRRAGDELSQADQSPAAKLVGQAADGLEQLSLSLADKQPEDLLNSVRDFGRRHPMAFIAGGVLVGVALGRFVRSSESDLDSAPEMTEFTPAYPIASSAYEAGSAYDETTSLETENDSAPGREL